MIQTVGLMAKSRRELAEYFKPEFPVVVSTHLTERKLMKMNIDVLIEEKRKLLSEQNDEIMEATAEIKAKRRPKLKALKYQIDGLRKGLDKAREADTVRATTHGTRNKTKRRERSKQTH